MRNAKTLKVLQLHATATLDLPFKRGFKREFLQKKARHCEILSWNTAGFLGMITEMSDLIPVIPVIPEYLSV